MYDIAEITLAQDSRMEKIHYAVFVPIVEYYINMNKIGCADVIVENESDANPGKTVKIAISGIECSKIYADIQADVFNIGNYINDCSFTDDGYIKVITN